MTLAQAMAHLYANEIDAGVASAGWDAGFVAWVGGPTPATAKARTTCAGDADLDGLGAWLLHAARREGLLSGGGA